MNGFYEITTRILNELQKAGFVVVTLGDYLKIDLERQNTLPYAHVVPLTSTIPTQTVVMTFAIIGMDIVDFNKDNLRDEDEVFFSTDNLQDVLNDIHNRMNQVTEQFRRGDEFSELFRLLDIPSLDPFFKRYENLYAGWELTVSFEMANNEVSICD